MKFMKKFGFELSFVLLAVSCLTLAACGDKKDKKETYDHTVQSGQSIQSVIDAAQAGQKILVEAGTYDEQLIIEKDITLVGDGTVVISGPEDYDDLEKISPATGSERDMWGLIVVKGGANATLKNITVKGEPTRAEEADIKADTTSRLDSRFSGVVVYNANATLDHVNIKDMVYGGVFYGYQNGFGVYVDGAEECNLTVTDCEISNFQKCGILVKTANSTTTVTNTTIIGTVYDNCPSAEGEEPTSEKTNDKIAQNGMQIQASAKIKNCKFVDLFSSVVDKNDDDRHDGATGIFYWSKGHEIDIGNNTFINVETESYDFDPVV